jgi:hypothetical protein
MNNTCLIALCLAVLAPRIQASETSEVVNSRARGQAAGLIIRIQKSEQVEHRLSPTNPQTVQSLGVFVNGQLTNMPVDIAAFCHTYIHHFQSGYEFTNTCYELIIRSRGDTNFEWSAWSARGGFTPDDITILNAASGRSYAFYWNDLFYLFRLDGMRPSKQMREVFFSNEPHPDALPPLSTRATQVVTTNHLGTINRSMHSFAVEGVRETTNGLHLTLRVDNTESKVIYTLRDGQWTQDTPQ